MTLSFPDTGGEFSEGFLTFIAPKSALSNSKRDQLPPDGRIPNPHNSMIVSRIRGFSTSVTVFGFLDLKTIDSSDAYAFANGFN